MTCAVFCDGISATDPLVDADTPPSVTAKDIPAIPNTDTALARRFPFETRFICDMAEFLLPTFLRTNTRRMHP